MSFLNWIRITLFPVLLLIASCGSPTQPAPAPAGGPPDMRLSRFTMRFQSVDRRVAEISGDSAAVIGASSVRMDSAQFVLFQNNLAFLELAAPDAMASLADRRESAGGSIEMPSSTGRLYYGGRFKTGRMTCDMAAGKWKAEKMNFERDPLSFVADESSGGLNMEIISAAGARLRASGSNAQAPAMAFYPSERRVVLSGGARFTTDTETVRADTLVLRIDPTFSRLTLLR